MRLNALFFSVTAADDNEDEVDQNTVVKPR